MLFGEILGVKVEAGRTTVTVQERVHVTISWLQAKLLAGLLTQVIQSFEEANGPINLPNLAKMRTGFELPFEKP